MIQNIIEKLRKSYKWVSNALSAAVTEKTQK